MEEQVLEFWVRGSGLVAILSVFHNGGALGGAFIEVTGGVFFGTQIIGNAGK